MGNSASLASSSSPPVIPIDPPLRQLLDACSTGDFNLINDNPSILLSTTPHKNNCLHIAAMLGHHDFAREVWSRDPSLLFDTNNDDETPLIAALMAAKLPLAIEIITAMQNHDLEEGSRFNRTLLQVNKRGENALHHAMRNGFEDFALQLLQKAPQLSEQVIETGESPMYMAARRGYSEVVQRLLEIRFSADSGPKDRPAKHASSADSGPVDGPAIHSSSADSGPVDGPAIHASSADSGPVDGPAIHSSSADSGPVDGPAIHASSADSGPVDGPAIYASSADSGPVDGPAIHSSSADSGPVDGPAMHASSAGSGRVNRTAMHAAVRFNQKGIVEKLLEKRPQLAYCKDTRGNTPLDRAIGNNNLELVRVFLKHDPELAYVPNPETGRTPFIMAARSGFVSIAIEIMSTCPDSVYTPNKDGHSALHEAIICEQHDFIDYILRTPQLHRLINQANNIGSLPLHYAAAKCDPKLLRSLLSHEGQDYTAVNVTNESAVDIVFEKHDLWKTLKWNESFALLSKKIPSATSHTSSYHTKNWWKEQAIHEVKSLTTKYTSNTSLVAALLATITFAAAFTLPGGFSTNPSDVGQPIFARETSFKVFLIFDTIAMCSSLVVAFLCILATWEDLDFLLNYRKTTRVLMWCAYEATAVAFGTGLFTVIKPNNLYLAIFILVLCAILPFLSMIISYWPIIMVWYRLRGHFRKDLVPKI